MTYFVLFSFHFGIKNKPNKRQKKKTTKKVLKFEIWKMKMETKEKRGERIKEMERGSTLSRYIKKASQRVMFKY